jgi:hypothetical protein
VRAVALLIGGWRCVRRNGERVQDFLRAADHARQVPHNPPLLVATRGRTYAAEESLFPEASKKSKPRISPAGPQSSRVSHSTHEGKDHCSQGTCDTRKWVAGRAGPVSSKTGGNCASKEHWPLSVTQHQSSSAC